MTFQKLLNDYLTQLGCTARELSAVSGISAPVISRYRSGSHSPDLAQCRKLSAGIAALAVERGWKEITQESVESAFREALTFREGFDKERFRHNLNELLDAFSIGNTELARYLSYDASYLSRIRSGQRTPRDTAAFALSVGRFVARRCQSGGELEQLAALIGASLSADAGNEEYAREVAQYLCAKDAVGSTGNMERFLQKMDEFDLEEYIRVIHFNEIKAPTSPLQLPTARFYTGLSELMDAQLDFLKATVLSRSAGPVTMYSDLPMVVRNVKGYRNLQKKLREQSPEEVEKDPDFKVTIQTTRQVWGAIVALGILAGTTLAFSVFSLWPIITFYDAAFVALFVLCFTLTLPSLAMMIAYIRLLPITAELESTEKTA